MLQWLENLLGLHEVHDLVRQTVQGADDYYSFKTDQVEIPKRNS